MSPSRDAVKRRNSQGLVPNRGCERSYKQKNTRSAFSRELSVPLDDDLYLSEQGQSLYITKGFN